MKTSLSNRLHRNVSRPLITKKFTRSDHGVFADFPPGVGATFTSENAGNRKFLTRSSYSPLNSARMKSSGISDFIFSVAAESWKGLYFNNWTNYLVVEYPQSSYEFLHSHRGGDDDTVENRRQRSVRNRPMECERDRSSYEP